jgi:hypothetical protein
VKLAMASDVMRRLPNHASPAMRSADERIFVNEWERCPGRICPFFLRERNTFKINGLNYNRNDKGIYKSNVLRN